MRPQKKTSAKNREKGAMLALVAIALPVLLGGVGLVMDTGALYDMKRRVQGAADAAAVAAAQEIRLANADGVEEAARYDAKKNGFVSTKTASVEVTNPPKRGHYAGQTDYVEVVVTEQAPSFFMRALTEREFAVSGRAVASVASNSVCTWTLDPTAKYSFDATGSAAVAFKDCGLFVNSNTTQAARTAGKATVSAPSIDVVGNSTGSGFSPSPRTGASQLGDPFADMTKPPVASTCTATDKKVQATETLSPGVYCGGLTFTAKANATFKPGVYVLKGGGMSVAGKAKLTGAGVTFFNTAGGSYSFGDITFNGGAVATLSAPTSGATKGMLFMDDNTYEGKTHTFNGGADLKLTGAFYAPNTLLKMAGNFSADASNMILVAKNINVTGTMTFTKMPISTIPPVLAVARVVE
jgi:Flp pilus assembly protein TadG